MTTVVAQHAGQWVYMPIIPRTAIVDLHAGLEARPECSGFYYDEAEADWVYLTGGTSKRKKIRRIP